MSPLFKLFQTAITSKGPAFVVLIITATFMEVEASGGSIMPSAREELVHLHINAPLKLLFFYCS